MKALFGVLAALALAACTIPGTPDLGSDLTVGSLQLGGSNARLLSLGGGNQIPVTLSGNQASLVTLTCQQDSSERATVSFAGRRSLRTFEGRLRDWETPLREAPPPVKKTYRLSDVPRHNLGDQEDFWVIADLAAGKATEIQVPARAAYVGEHCYVFLDQQITDTSLDARIDMIGQTFDSKIYPTDTRLFGRPLAQGVNGDPRVSILISPVVGNYGRDSTIGYFTLRDLYAPGSDPTNPSLKRSNQRLMLYVSPYVVGNGQPADFLGTIAHELQHLINASQKLFRSGNRAGKVESLWLDEGLAMYAMEANGYGLSGDSSVVFNHVAAYLAEPGAYSLTDWDASAGQASYGMAYLFTNYLAQRFGEKILNELVASDQVGLPNVATSLNARNTTFRAVFDEFALANMLDDTALSTDARHQYKNLNLLGTYGTRRLRGVRLEALTAPGKASVELLPYSARYFLMPRSVKGSFDFALAGQGGGLSGFMIVP